MTCFEERTWYRIGPRPHDTDDLHERSIGDQEPAHEAAALEEVVVAAFELVVASLEEVLLAFESP